MSLVSEDSAIKGQEEPDPVTPPTPKPRSRTLQSTSLDTAGAAGAGETGEGSVVGPSCKEEGPLSSKQPAVDLSNSAAGATLAEQTDINRSGDSNVSSKIVQKPRSDTLPDVNRSGDNMSGKIVQKLRSDTLPHIPPRLRRPCSTIDDSSSERLTKRNTVDARRSLSEDRATPLESSLIKQLSLPRSPSVSASPHTTAAPPIPPHSPPTPVSNHSRRLRSAQCREDWVPLRRPAQGSISEDEVVLTLPQLVEEHSRNFPLRATVVNGLGEQVAPRTSINIHFLKQTKVVDISNSINQRHTVPLNSSLKFGLIYCPGVKTESFLFEKVSDITQADDLPKVVTCTKKAKGKQECSSVTVNEVLVILNVVPGKSAKKLKLKVFSITHNQEKVLAGDLTGRFSTDPKLARLYLSDILKHVPDTFPVSARLFVDKDSSSPSPASSSSQSSLLECLTKGPVTLLDSLVETSLIASYCSGQSEGGQRIVIDLPIHPDIHMGVSYRDDRGQSAEKLRSTTLSVWNDLTSPVDKQTIHPKVLSAGGDVVQHALLTMVRKGWERDGQAILTPQQLRKELTVDVAPLTTQHYQVLMMEGNGYMPLLSTSMSSDYYSTTEDDSLSVGRGEAGDEAVQREPVKDTTRTRTSSPITPITPITPSAQTEDKENERAYNPRTVRRIEALELRVANAAPQDKVQRLTRRLEALELRVPSFDAVEQQRSEREVALKAEVESLRETVGTLRDQVRAMEAEMREARAEMTEMAELLKRVIKENSQEKNCDTQEKNRQELKKMGTEQIVKILEALKIPGYKDTFLEENISGEILAECDEEVMTQDLGMADPLHRSKLMEVIRGKVSPLALVGDDAYVRFKANKT